LNLVFVNLLTNAIRFTPRDGAISIQLTADETEAHVVVQDNGIGLAEDQLEKIFDQFYQVEDHMTRQFGGLGLGLSIAKAFVELHEGRIWAESAGLGQGAAFHIVLPRTDDLGKGDQQTK
jgi:signal transduction histidine kinase